MQSMKLLHELSNYSNVSKVHILRKGHEIPTDREDVDENSFYGQEDNCVWEVTVAIYPSEGTSKEVTDENELLTPEPGLNQGETVEAEESKSSSPKRRRRLLPYETVDEILHFLSHGDCKRLFLTNQFVQGI